MDQLPLDVKDALRDYTDICVKGYKYEKKSILEEFLANWMKENDVYRFRMPKGKLLYYERKLKVGTKPSLRFTESR